MATLAIIRFKNLYQALIPALFAFFSWTNPSGGIAGSEALAGFSLWHCPFLTWTGWACPGCGLTRSMISFFSSDFETSFYFHPLGPAIGLGIVALWACSFFVKDFSLTHSNSRATAFAKKNLLTPGLALFLAWGVLRNLLDLY